MRRFLFLTLLSVIVYTTNAQTTKYGPQMGWSSWNTYGVNINETLVKLQADAMRNNGYADAGYKYINIDDGFFGGRDSETGKLKIHPSRFPNGMKSVVDYIHSRGLKAGIYSDAGNNTCGSEFSGDPISLGCGMWEHYEQDAKLYYDELEFDFIKVDFCGGRQLQEAGNPVNDRILYGYVFEELDKARKRTGRDIKINVCRWSYPGTWVEGSADSWRTTGDIYCAWESVRGIIHTNLYLSAFSSAGHFNDMDMLEVGRGLSTEEDRTHFSMWCMLNSPLMIGCNMATINASTKKLLTNAELIGLNQDTLYQQAYVVDNQDGVYLLVRDIEHLNDTMRAVAVYNSTDKDVTYIIDFNKLDLGGKVKIRSITFGTTLTQLYEGSYSIKVPAHGTRVFRMDAQERKERTIYEAETAYLSQFHEDGKTNAYASTVGGEWSGGVKVGFLGNRPENDLRWRNVYSKEGGKYKCTIYYALEGTRKFTMTVNGKNETTYSVNGTSYNTPKPIDMEIELQPGYNEIRLFSKTSDYCPDIDRMELELIEPLTGIEAYNSPNKSHTVKDDRIFDINGNIYSNTDNIPAGMIYIQNGEKRQKN